MEMKDMDKNFESIRERMQSYEQKPNAQMWENISTKVAKPKISYLTGAVIAISVLLVGFVGVLLFTPSKSESNVEKAISKSTPTEVQFVAKNETVEFVQTPNEETEIKIEQTETKIQDAEIKTEFSANEQAKSIETVFVEPQSPKTSVAPKQSTVIANQPIAKVQNSTPKAESKTLTASSENIVETLVETKNSPDILVGDTARMKLFIPNAFTPSESTNNIFKPAFAEILDYRMDIFNRQGVMVFSSKDITMGWNGKTNNADAPQGGYYYVVRFKDLKGNTHTQKGSLMLLR